MSFKLFDGDIDNSTFALQTSTSSPTTGIKISQTMNTEYTVQEVFIFTVFSSDATLSDLVISSGVYDDDPNVSTYKEYDYTPTFDSGTYAYTLELLEYIDELDFKFTTSNENATVSLKTPKRDTDGGLIYDNTGQEIEYETNAVTDLSVAQAVQLNALGEADTIVTIIVTAEDGTTVNEYVVTIKRPCALITGAITTVGNYKGTVRVYESDVVSAVIDWTTVSSGTSDTLHDDLTALESNDIEIDTTDGTFAEYVIPGTYDILLDKAGYLDHIFTSKTLADGDTLDLGTVELVAGDVNKDGIIQGTDVALVAANFGADATTSNYDESYDLNGDDSIQGTDTAITVANYLQVRTVE